jgi:hypothetical protein
MKTKDEALKMAIEAFDNIDMSNQTNEECARAWFIEGYVQALEWPPKEALEQPSVAELNDQYLHDTYVQGLSQPAQEPVAYCKHGVPKGVCTLGEKDCNHAPAWQGLSNDRIREIGDNCLENNNGLFNWIDFARAIEQALKEKNT